MALAASGFLSAIAGCSEYQHQERPPWRAQAEEACLAKGLVSESALIRASPALNGPGICGAEHPFKVAAIDGGAVTLNATQTLDCPMIAALDRWVSEVVQPAAQARFGEPVVRVNSMGSYSCRGINNRSGANLSEHSFANAIDIGGFVLASGRELNIRRGFNGTDEQERAFLHEAHAGACSYFTTVLGPGYNAFHYNHFHVDLAMHGSTSRGPRRYCKPVPQTNLPEPPVRDNLPDPPAIEEEQDIARAPLPEPAYRSGPATLVASVPPPPPPMPERGPALMPRPVAVARAPRAAHPPSDELPLISFAEEQPAARPRTAPLGLASMPNAVPQARRIPHLVTGSAETDWAGEAPLDAEPPLDGVRPAKVDGSPKDWDITSSVKR